MKKWISVAAMLSAMVLVGGCNTVTKTEYTNVKTALNGSPAFRKEIIADCKNDFRHDSAAEKANMAAVMNVSVAQLPSAFCTRLYSAVASGRFTYADYVAAKTRSDYVTLIKVLQGR